MNLEQKFNKNNMKIENRGNKIYITSNYNSKDTTKEVDKWFIYKFEKKLILFHKSKSKTERKNKNNELGDSEKLFFHKQKVFYNFDSVISEIVSHDKYKKSETNINNLFNLIENNNIPKLSF